MKLSKSNKCIVLNQIALDYGDLFFLAKNNILFLACGIWNYLSKITFN